MLLCKSSCSSQIFLVNNVEFKLLFPSLSLNKEI